MAKPSVRVLLWASLVSLHLNAQNFPGWYTYDTLSSPLPSNLVTSLAVGPDRTMWIGTAAGLVALSEQLNWTIYDTANSPLTDNWIKCLYMESSGVLWIGTLQGGLFSLDNGVWSHYSTANAPWLTNNISAITRRASGDLWVGTHGQGIFVLSGGTWQHFNQANTGHDLTFVNDLEADDSNCVWVATHNAGLLKFCGQSWTAYNPLNTNFNTAHVQAVCLEAEGYVWVGLAGSRPDSALHRLDRSTGQWTIYGSHSTGGEGIGSVWDIRVDQFGRKWIATNEITRGAWLFNDTLFTVFNAGYCGLTNNRVLAVAERQDTSYWFATISGLSLYKPSLAASNSLFPVSAPSLFVGPVPTADYLLIKLDVAWGADVTVRLLEATGATVQQWSFTHLETKQILPLHTLPPGPYVLEVRGGEYVTFRKFVKI
ncbi:MAG: hypothetical protein N2110_07500 [Flavobacteriales bacterium]|nr:hypothetical protein [Flavobacteriales bacterium]MCX7768849.1 hypothetical protein [Flavobacteriales bacterium]MDW8410519.1 two-component regulator propeller domain-containing protein [Flavobacteriales bacterium]